VSDVLTTADITELMSTQDAESISSLPPIKSSMPVKMSKTWSNSSWKSWKSSSSKAQKWNYQTFKSNVRNPGAAGPGGGSGSGSGAGAGAGPGAGKKR
jgi:hypothetical protein